MNIYHNIPHPYDKAISGIKVVYIFIEIMLKQPFPLILDRFNTSQMTADRFSAKICGSMTMSESINNFIEYRSSIAGANRSCVKLMKMPGPDNNGIDNI